MILYQEISRLQPLGWLQEQVRYNEKEPYLSD